MERNLYFKWLLVLAVIQLFSTFAWSQSPGGVSSNLNLWLKADSGPENAAMLPAGNGDGVITWRDRSGVANDYVAVAGPTLVSGLLNYNPAVQILSGGFDAPAGAALGTNWTTFFVSRKRASDNSGRVFDGATGNYLWAHWGNYTNSIYINGNPSNFNSGIATTTGITDLHLHTFRRESAGGTLEARADGSSLNTFGSSNSGSGIRIDINQGAFSASESSHSDIGEVILYNTALSSTDIQKVESYLASKYGLTLTHDYLTSNGTVIWNYAGNTGFNNDITVVGRDDNSSLSQLVSTSANASADATITSAGFGSDLSFVVLGNNGASSGTSTDVPIGYSRRLNKIWKAGVSGSPGSVNISFDLTDLGLPVALNPAEYELLINSAGSFGTTTSTVSGFSVTNSVVTFNNVTLVNGDFITIAATDGSLNAPAGITDNLKLWLKADAGVTGSIPVSNWSDQSGNGFNATAPGNAPDLLASQVNGNPAMDFVSTNSEYLSITNGIFGSSAYSNAWVYAVSKADVIQNQTLFYESLAGGETFNGLVPWGNSNVYYDFGQNGGAGRINGSWGGSTSGYDFWTLGASTGTTTPSGTQRAIYRDGALILSNSNNDSGSGNNQPFFIGGGFNSGIGTTNPFDGKLAELIVYTAAPTVLEQEKIHSYLALKYGITKSSSDNPATAGEDERDYFASDGSVIWDYSASNSYHNNVAGVGRDDGSQLEQVQSRSVNSGADVTITKTGGFLTDLSFVVWGDNNAANGTSTDVPAPLYEKRLNKIWRAHVTGTPGPVDFSIDLTDLGLPVGLPAASYALLLDADGTFSTTTTVHTAGAALANSQLSFTGVSFTDGDYFTVAVLATALVGPANVTDNLKLWLKADAGVTGTTPVSAWADQSGNGFSATAPGNAPDLLSTQLNGNPVIDFTSASSEYLSITSGLFGSSTYNDMWIYTVHKADAIQNNTIFHETLLGGERFSTLLPWGDSNVYFDYANGGAGRLNGAWGGSINNYNLWTLGSSTGTSTPNGTRKTISRDGLVILSNNNNDSGTGTNQPFLIGGGYATGLGTSNPFDGKLAEMIVYNGVPSELDQEKIQSYLSVKYGLTKNSLDIAATAAQDERDYFSAGGNVIWDYSSNASYHNRVTGIGRDDASQLLQLNSRSILTGSIVSLTTSSFGTDNSFVLVGDDNASLASTSGVPSPYTRRTTRIWRADGSGAPGAISVSFDMSTGVHNSGIATDYALLIKNGSTDFSTGATVHTAGASFANNTLTFTGVTLNPGDNFTLGILVTTPISLSPVFWVKADLGVTGTTDVSIWADQSGNGNNATQATVANQPSLVSTDINYNPTISFSGSTDIMSPITPPANLNSTIFTVAIPNVNTSWRTMLRGSVNDHPIIVENGGTRLGYYDNDNGQFRPSGFTWLQGEPALVGVEMRTGDVNFRKNGSQGTSIATIDLTGLNLNFFGNYQGNGQAFGRIAETIIFNGSALTSAQKEGIESYLAIKYGITLTHNYYSSASANLWDVTANALYTNRVTGIGRDNGNALDQRKSKSVHAGSVLTVEKTTPTSPFGTDLDYLLVGDDNGVLGATVTNLHPSYPMRVTRIWRTDAQGTPGTVSLSFDLGSGIYNSGNAADYAVIIKSSDANFTSGATAHTTGASLVAGVLTFTNVPLTDDTYFTLALPRIASPGGTIDNLRLWLRADAGVTGGANVSTWADQTSYYYSATQGTAGNQPAVLSNRLNFNPAIQFDGTNDQLNITGGIIGTATYNDINIFTITRTNTIQASSVFYETQSTGGRISVHTPWNDNTIYWDAGSTSASQRLQVNWGGTTGVPYLWSLLASTTGTPLGSNQSIVRNGRSIASDATMGSFTGNGSTMTLGVNASNNFYNGELSEMIAYTGTLSAAQYSRIQSYLAIKYGITLDQTTATNYVASDGSIIWDATLNATYRNDIAGIGRDDASALSQTQSKSVNSASLVTMNKGGAFSNDLDFIVWGNDNAYNSPTTVGRHPSYPYRLGRTWRVDLTGTPGQVSVSFDLSNGIYNSTNANDYALLIHTSNDFTAGTAHVTGRSFNGSVITFTNVSFADGDFFTLGMPTPPAPGGVVNNMGIWVKADLGVTGATNASAWSDQSGNNFNLSQATGTNQPAIVSNRHNFNPSIQFDGSNDNLSLTSGILGTNSFTDIYTFGVTRTNTISNSYVFYETATSGQFDVRIPWGDNTLYWEPGNTGTNRVSANTWSGTTSMPYLWALTSSTTATPSSQRQDIIRNGFTLASDASMGAFTGNSGTFYIGSGPNSNYYNGEVSEMVIYRGALTALQLQQVQSYLAIKYGITLSGTDYVNSSGTTIFGTTTTHSGYLRDIGVIGRDDNSALSQPKSKSVNTPSDLITIANADFSTPGTFGSNNQFLGWGNNGQPNIADPSAVSFTHNGVTIERQLVRIWSTQKTGSPSGNAIVEVDMSTVVGPSGIGTNNTADIRLLVDNDATFGNASAGELTFNSSSIMGNKLYFTIPYASIPSGQGYFTVGSTNTASFTAPTPGGVIGDIRLWLRADAGTTGTTPVTAWADQSPNAFVASAVGNSPQLLANQVNSNPALDFTRTNSEYLRIGNGITGINTYNDMWTFGVVQGDALTDNTLVYEAMAGGEAFSILLPWSNANIYFDYGIVGGTGRLNGAWGGTLGAYNLWTIGSSTSTSTPNGTRKTISRDGAVILSNNNNDGVTGGNQNFLIGGGYNTGSGTSNPSDSRIAELVVFGEIPTPLEQEKIQSYLAVKYGITKNSADLASTPAQDERDYFASDGTVIWDYSVNSAYSNRITGIGRDNNTALNQTKSQNIAALSFVSMDNSGTFADKTYLMWGSDNGLLGLTTSGANAALTYRLGRVWRVDWTGTPATVTVGFDLSTGIYNSGNASDYRLYYGNSSSDFSGAAVVTGTFVGNVITFSGVNFLDGDFFTLGVANMPAPGGVVPNMQYWVKGDAGVTGASNASSWADQSGNAFNVSQATGSSQPAVVSSRSNFNTSIQFDGTNDQMTLTGGIMGTTTYTDINVFAVARVNTVTASSIFFETQSAGGRINVHLPWSDNIVYWDAGSANANQRLSGAWGGSTGNYLLWNFGASTTTTASGVRQDIFRNGRRIFNDATMTSFTGNNSTFNLGSSGGGGYFNGEIAEAVIYRGALTAAQQTRIQSYLALKHGITLDQTSATNYYASDWNGTTGTAIWNAMTAGTYRTDIAAIGRDNNSGLHQKQSGSINTGNVLTIGNVSIAADNVANTNSLTNMSFFSWAHNNGVMDAEAVDDLPAGVATRIARVWLGQETGIIGTTRIRFNLSAVMGAGGVVGNNDLANVRLLVDADGTFVSGATLVSPATFNNTTDIIEFDHDFTAGTGFYFTVGSIDRASAPLPVELLSFSARPTSQGTVVEWITASEYNCDFFEVQVSTSDNIWTALEKVNGQGTTNLQTAYEFIDKQPLMGKSYYRLRQVDFDGKEEFSEVILVIYETNAVNIYPNPSSEYVTIQVDEEVGFIQRLTISSLQGTKQWEKAFASVGTQKYQVDISGLPGGVYLVHVDGSRSRAMKKLVVINSR